MRPFTAAALVLHASAASAAFSSLGTPSVAPSKSPFNFPHALAVASAADDRLEVLRRQLADAAAPGAAEALAVVRACDGLERGASASPEQAAAVDAAVAAFESTSPCTLQNDALIRSLSGQWTLMYSTTLVRPVGSRRRDAARRRLVDSALRPSLGDVSQSGRGEGSSGYLDEEIALSLPAPFPLPRQELRLVFSQSVDATARAPGKFRCEIEELQITRAEGSRRVTLPSPRKLLDGTLSNFGRLFPLELTLLTELAWSPAGAPRELTCTAVQLRGEARVRVVRSATGEMRIFEHVGGGDAPTAGVMAALPPPAERSPVGHLDERGEPVEEFWAEGDGLGDDWLGYMP